MPKPREQLVAEVKQEITRLHTFNKSDYQSLMRQVNKEFEPYRIMNLNLFQKLAKLSRAPGMVHPAQIHYYEIGRGGGKTTDMGDMMDVAAAMFPRGSGQFIASTYLHFLDRIIPSLRDGLEMWGVFENLHYFVRKEPPKNWNWEVPFKKPSDIRKHIRFYTGFGLNLISQDVKDDGKALNTDIEFGDESQKLDPEKMYENTTPALRGSKKLFESKPWFKKRFHRGTVDMVPTWIRDLHARQQQLDIYNRKREPKAREYAVNLLRFPCTVNLGNLPANFLADARAEAEAKNNVTEFKAFYLNEIPPSVEDGFYSLLNEKIHGYYPEFDIDNFDRNNQKRGCLNDSDCVRGVPLVIGADFGSAINCLNVCQNLQTINEFRVLKSMFVLGINNEIQDDLYQKFHDYYQFHDNRTVYLWYDASGNVETGFTRRNRAEMIRDQLSKLGWSVQLMTQQNTNPFHTEKFYLYQTMFKGDAPHLPKFRINMVNARDTYVSMTNAPAKTRTTGDTNKIEKDKRSEARLRTGERQRATDLSDALDSAIWGTFENMYRNRGVFVPGMVIR